MTTDRSASGHLLDKLAGAQSKITYVRFVTPNGTIETSFAELWSLSSRTARAIVDTLPPGPVAGVMTPGPSTIATLVGCLRAGRDFVSLPLPGRGQSPEGYVGQLKSIVELSNAGALVIASAYADLLLSTPGADLGCPVIRAEHLAATTDVLRSDANPGDLIQFSSGTTGKPKGVRLTGWSIAANLDSLLDAFDVHDEPQVYCGWIPLSHDMGLIGGLLGSWVGADRTRSGYQYICISPELFLARPLVWMETCASVKATATAAPTFAYHVLARQLLRAPVLDLSHLRKCAIGAEPINIDGLRNFAGVAARHGFREAALCPAYGLAEATLAVSMVRTGSRFSSRTICVEGRSNSYVSCGPVFDCVRVDAPDVASGPGPIRISGPAVCSGYVAPRDAFRDGWLDTGDLGFLAEGELFITGRVDDLLCVAGRNLFAWELERAAAVVPDVRAGDCAVVTDGRGRYVVLFEARGALEEKADDTFSEVRRELAKCAGIGPSGVGLLRRGALPKTPSGKIRRNLISSNLTQLIESCVAYKEY